jgi:hypothetical protein
LVHAFVGELTFLEHGVRNRVRAAARASVRLGALIRIVSIDPSPIALVRHLAAARTGEAAARDLPVVRGIVDGLPDGLEALVVASDLQGVVGERLLGIEVAEQLAALVPDGERTAVLLAGDLYSAPAADVRGASGDVREVWRAFAARFRWVAGVAGNHDTFGGGGFDRGRSFREPRTHVLDGELLELDGLRVGGVGGIIGDSAKPARRDEREFIRELKRLLASAPDVVVLHHGPDAERGELRGHEEVRRAFARSGPVLVVCGHVYWPRPLAELRGGAQALNADGRVVVLARA